MPQLENTLKYMTKAFFLQMKTVLFDYRSLPTSVFRGATGVSI